jgi:hypothetical protein
MPYVYNPRTGKNDLWQAEERTVTEGTTGRTSTVMADKPSPGQALIGGLSRFGSEFMSGITTKQPSRPFTGYNTKATKTAGTGVAGPAKMGVMGPTGQTTGMYSATAEQRQNYLDSLKTSTEPTQTSEEEKDIVTTEEDGTASTTPLFSSQDLLKSRTDLANQLREYQDAVARNASDEQKRSLADKVRKTERAYQQGLQQISEQDFMQQRALTQGAQARGLGGSGLEQLGRTQARMQTGQQLNQLSQNYGDQLQGYLNTQLGIEEKLATALSGNALTEMGNINEAEIESLNLQWTQEQQNWSREDRAKFDTEQGAAHFADLFAALKGAGEDAQQRGILKETYSKLLPPATVDRLMGMTSSGAAGDTAGKVTQTGMAPSNAAEREDFAAAMAKDEGDGQLSMLKVGNSKRYFPNDDALVLHVKNLYANRENADNIQIVVKGGGVRYVTPDGQEFDTYNKASNAIG